MERLDVRFKNIRNIYALKLVSYIIENVAVLPRADLFAYKRDRRATCGNDPKPQTTGQQCAVYAHIYMVETKAYRAAACSL